MAEEGKLSRRLDRLFDRHLRPSYELADEWDALAIEMEGSALCGVAERFGVPWLIVRALSDRAGEDSIVDFGAFVSSAAASSARLVRELLPAFDALEDDHLTVKAIEEAASPEAFESWNVPGTPFVALVIDGVVRAKGLVNTLEQIDGLIDLGRERARGGV